MNTALEDSNQILKFACRDLKAIRAAAQVIEAEKNWSSEREMLAVIIRALTPIIDDIQNAINNIDTALKVENDGLE